MTLSRTKRWLVLGYFLLPVPLSAQISNLVVPSGESVRKEFRVKSDIDCPRSNYEFRLTSDRDFLRLPEDTVELSNRDSAIVVIEFDARGLEPGYYNSTVNIDCIDCGRCRSRRKSLTFAMAVVEGMPGDDETLDEEDVDIVVQIEGFDEEELAESTEEDERPLPSLEGASVDEALVLIELAGMVLTTDIPDIERRDLLRVVGQRPPTGTSAPVGTEVSLEFGVPVPDLVGLTVGEALTLLAERGLTGDGGTIIPVPRDGARVTTQTPGVGDIYPVGLAVALAVEEEPPPPRWLPWIAALAIILAAYLIFLWRRKSRRRDVSGVDFDVETELDPGCQRTATEPDIAGPVVSFRLGRDAGTQSMRTRDPA